MQALSAWRVFVSCLVRSRPELLERVVVQVAVVMLPQLEESGQVQRLAVGVLEELVIRQKQHTKG